MFQRTLLQPVVFLAALVCLLAGTAIAAAAEVATVVALRGAAVAVDTAGAERALAIKAPVYVDDTIRTGPRGRLQLMFTDNTIISLGINAELEIAEYEWDQQAGALNTRVNQGAFRVMGGSVARTSPEKFTTDTPAATIGIRGSMYAGRVSDGALAVVFQGGTGIIVSNPAGTVEITTPGMGTRVASRTTAPTPPAVFTQEDLDALEEEEPEEETEEETTEEGATEDEAAAEEPAEEEWEEAALDEPDSAETPVAAATAPTTDTTVEQVSETTTEAGQEELEQTVEEETTEPEPTEPEAAGYSGRGIEIVYDGTELEATVEHLVLTAKPAELTEIEADLLAQNEQDGFSDEAYGEIWSYSDFSFEEPENEEGFYISSSFAMVDNRGEFWLYKHWSDTETDEGWTYSEKLFFYGQDTPAELMPVSGGAIYHGLFTGAVDDVDYGWEEILGDFSVAVNWETGKVVGYFMDDDHYYGRPIPVYLTAEVDGSSLTAAKIFGLDYENNYYGDGSSVDAWVTAGSGTFAQFYGTYHQGLGVVAEGQSSALFYNDEVENWSVVGGAFRDPVFTLPEQSASATWQGFVTAMDFNLWAEPGTPPELFRNTEADDFQLQIDRQAGLFSGEIIEAESATTAGFSIGGLEVVGFYVNDNFLAGEISSASDTDLQGVLGGSGEAHFYGYDFEDDGVDSENIEDYYYEYHIGELAEHVSWGYWGLAYVDQDGAPHVFSPHGSFWVAGELTPAETVNDLIGGDNFTGTYTGGAEGLMIFADTMEDLYNGQTTLNINFGTAAIDGSIVFPDVVGLEIGGNSALTADGFAADIISAYDFVNEPFTASGGISGAFFGPNAESVGGNFHADTGSAQYLGIFGGNLE
ncbi:FecR domain-containing protein [Desulfurivibrio dismutans]|uniref:FecR domain-containing protein n=1 Tax=Desulfurivibrio dismutans TaxID=1398908 RepID=UPI0023DA589D|nr:FecR domain-containing protein [Desulfurivibrio alkaliphilus]MDF1615653.1 FecR domain-containing protein [Desulfurivibrio alkaliphilus]